MHPFVTFSRSCIAASHGVNIVREEHDEALKEFEDFMQEAEEVKKKVPGAYFAHVFSIVG